MEHLNKVWWEKRARSTDDPEEVVASGRHEFHPGTKRFIESRIKRLIQYSKDKNICLDAACGTGLYIPLLLTEFNKVVGMDFSPAVLSKAIPEAKDSERVTLIEGSLTAIPLTSDSFPFIFCRSTFQCLSLDDVEKAIQEFHRVLKPGGFLLLHFRNSTTIGYKISALKALLSFKLSAYRKLMKTLKTEDVEENFVPGEVYLRPYRYYFKKLSDAGFELIDYFSFQFFIWKYLDKKGKADKYETIERRIRKIPFLDYLVKTDGIDFYVLTRKPAT